MIAETTAQPPVDDPAENEPPLRRQRFVSALCAPDHRRPGDRGVNCALTGLRLDEATVVITIDDLASAHLRTWLSMLQSRGPTSAGPKITIELVR